MKLESKFFSATFIDGKTCKPPDKVTVMYIDEEGDTIGKFVEERNIESKEGKSIADSSAAANLTRK